MAMVNKPQNRMELVQPVVERLGGAIIGAWFSFGDYDVLGIVQMPSNVNAAAISYAILSAGAARDLKVTPLMTMGEGMEAMRKASDARYKPPMDGV